MSRSTKEAGTIRFCKVTHADNLAVTGIETWPDAVKKICFAVLKVAAKGKSTQVGQLDHPGKRRIDKQGGLNDVADLGPEGALLMENLHKSSEL